MPTYLTPGVYIEELPSGSRPIEGVATSVTAFVGAVGRGPAGVATPISNYDDYTRTFGPIAGEDDAMGFAVQAFYLNGGKNAYVCRLVGDGADAASLEVAGADSGGADVLRIQAGSVGAWGNEVFVRIIKPDPVGDSFTLEVGAQTDGEFEAEETFEDLTMRADDDRYALSVVNDESLLVRLALTDDTEDHYQDAVLRGGALDPADATYFNDAAGGLWTLTLSINGLGTRQITVDSTAVDLSGGHTDDADNIAAAVQTAVNGLGTASDYTGFTCGYDSTTNRFTLTSPGEDSNASIEIFGGTLADLLRIGDARATLAGDTIAGVADDHFSNGFAGLATDADRTLSLEVDNRPAVDVTLAAHDVDLDGSDANADAAALALAVQNAVRAVAVDVPAYADFSCAWSAAEERFALTSGSSSARDSGLALAGDSGLAGLMALNAADTPTERVGRDINQGASAVLPVQTLGTVIDGEGVGEPLTDGAAPAPTPANYTSFYNATLRKVRDVSIIVLPGEPWADDGSGNAAVAATLAFAERHQRMMVLVDPPADLELAQAATVNGLGLPTSTYTALYYPWVDMANPLYNVDTNPTAPRTVAVAPSAFAAGIWSKTDARRGVWKAPAGVETQLLGAAGLAFEVEDAEQSRLNPLGVNCIRRLPGFSSVIWGSRTLATRAAPEWRYVPVRRTALFIEQSIYNGIQWAVFEPNDHPLWSSLRGNIGAFMNGLFRSGAFQGATARDAYFVRCGLGDTMTQADIDRGQVIVIVGFAPLKPAEFVIVRIQQKVGQE